MEIESSGNETLIYFYSKSQEQALLDKIIELKKYPFQKIVLICELICFNDLESKIKNLIKQFYIHKDKALIEL